MISLCLLNILFRQIHWNGMVNQTLKVETHNLKMVTYVKDRSMGRMAIRVSISSYGSIKYSKLSTNKTFTNLL